MTANKLFVFGFVFLLFGCDIRLPSYPVRDVTGCYRFETENYTDILCLDENDAFRQSRIKDGVETEYNRGRLRSFDYKIDKSDVPFVGVVLHGFQKLETVSTGRYVLREEYDIQPKESFFGKTYLRIGGITDRTDDIYYYRIEE